MSVGPVVVGLTDGEDDIGLLLDSVGDCVLLLSKVGMLVINP